MAASQHLAEVRAEHESGRPDTPELDAAEGDLRAAEVAERRADRRSFDLLQAFEIARHTTCADAVRGAAAQIADAAHESLIAALDELKRAWETRERCWSMTGHAGADGDPRHDSRTAPSYSLSAFSGANRELATLVERFPNSVTDAVQASDEVADDAASGDSLGANSLRRRTDLPQPRRQTEAP